MNKITLVFPYYKNPKMLEYQMSIWRKYPMDVINNLEIIVVDDGSPVGFRAEEVFKSSIEKFGNFDFKIRKFRILVDLPWNIMQAKNIGIVSAAHEWIINTDIDHLVPAELLREIIEARLIVAGLYSFERVRHGTREVNNRHKETRMMHKSEWARLGLYDESFTGHYAFSEREFFDERLWDARLGLTNPINGAFKTPIERVDSDQVSDSATTGLVRKEGRDNAAYEEIKLWKAANNIGVQALRLPWKEIIL